MALTTSEREKLNIKTMNSLTGLNQGQQPEESGGQQGAAFMCFAKKVNTLHGEGRHAPGALLEMDAVGGKLYSAYYSWLGTLSSNPGSATCSV